MRYTTAISKIVNLRQQQPNLKQLAARLQNRAVGHDHRLDVQRLVGLESAKIEVKFG